MDWIKSLLPTIGGLLGGPLGAAAVNAAASALRLNDSSKESVEKALSGNLSAEQITALKKADADLEANLAELGIKAARIVQADRASARGMQQSTGSWVPAALACVVTVGYFGILLGLMTGDLKLWDNSAELLLGALTTAWGSIVAFYYGASHTPPEVKR